MINIIKAILQKLVGTTNRTFTSIGRPDETVAGKLYQHYGFKSYPPANCELMTIQYGNNTVSVAENDGNLLEASGTSVSLEEGDVALYNDRNVILLPANTDGVTIVTKDGASISVQGNGTLYLSSATGKIQIATHGGSIEIGSATGVLQPMANLAFVTAVCAALTALGKTGFDPATIATGVYNTKDVKAT